MKRTWLAVVFLGVVSIAFDAAAGERTTTPVSVDKTNRNAKGALGSARNSADAIQFIGCEAFVSGGLFQGLCFANSPAGVSVLCTTSSATMVQTILGISGDSFISFSWDTTSTCASLSVENFSNLEPKR